MSPSHPNREQLSAFLHGRLKAEDVPDLESHISGCETCCQVLREVSDDALLARLRGMTPQSTPAKDDGTATGRKDLLPPEMKDHPRYEIGKFLGSGGMGVVYQAEHRLMNRQVALKIIHRELLSNPRAMALFLQEVKAAARLSHPNIVTAYDAEQAGDLHFLVMEFVEGISLARYIQKNGTLDVARACFFVRQAAKGLQHAFEKGIVHRDIKPHNLMLTRKGQIKILDFGLAHLASESRVDSDSAAPIAKSYVLGTPDYIAPEQASDSNQVDIRADIYSLGCTLFTLLAGETPFGKGSSQTKIFFQKYRQARSVRELRADVPAELEALIKRMMAKDPAERFATPVEVVAALAPFAKGPSPTTTPPAAAAPPATTKPEALLEKRRVKEPPRKSSREFVSSCPFCKTPIRVPNRKRDASIRCRNCNSYFTAAPDEGR